MRLDLGMNATLLVATATRAVNHTARHTMYSVGMVRYVRRVEHKLLTWILGVRRTGKAGNVSW